MNILGIKPESPHSAHGTDTANIFSPMCLVTGRGAHGGERGESILRITNLRRDDEEDDDPSRGARHKHSPPSRPGTEFQMSSTTATRIYWHFRETFMMNWIIYFVKTAENHGTRRRGGKSKKWDHFPPKKQKVFKNLFSRSSSVFFSKNIMSNVNNENRMRRGLDRETQRTVMIWWLVLLIEICQ